MIEILVFLFLVLPSLIYSFAITVAGATLTTPSGIISVILRDLSLVFLILFFIWHNQEPWGNIGWTFLRGHHEILIGIALFVPLFLLASVLESYLVGIGLSSSNTVVPPVPATPYIFALTVLLVIVVAISEETIFRGYIILRLRTVTHSLWAAAALSAVIFSIGHGYEGNAGVVTIGILGFIYALIYIWRQSIIAPVVLHFLQDFTVLLVAPYLLPG